MCFRPFSALAFSALLLALAACSDSNSSDQQANNRPIARALGKTLYASDLEGIGRGMSSEDSALQVKLYAEKWVEDQLMYDAAAKNVEETPRIKRLVEDYRASLLLGDYEQMLLRDELDTSVTSTEISEYYRKNQEQYIRGTDWLRCHFVRISRSAPQAEQLRSLFKDNSSKNVEQIRSLCQAANATFQLEENDFAPPALVINRLPKDVVLERYLDGTVLDRSDDNYIYLLRVFEFRDRNQPAPLAQVQDEIRKIIIHLRSQEILRRLRRTIYQNAKTDGLIEIF